VSAYTSPGWVITCDAHDEDMSPCPDGMAGETGQSLRALRSDTRRAGWRYTPGHPTTGPERDLCPEHNPTRPDGAP